MQSVIMSIGIVMILSACSGSDLPDEAYNDYGVSNPVNQLEMQAWDIDPNFTYSTSVEKQIEVQVIDNQGAPLSNTG